MMTTFWEILHVQLRKYDVNRKPADQMRNLESLLKTRTQAHLKRKLPQHVSSILNEHHESTRILLIELWRNLWTMGSPLTMPDVLWLRAVTVTMLKLRSIGFWTRRIENLRNRRRRNPHLLVLVGPEVDLQEVIAGRLQRAIRTWQRQLLQWVTACSRLLTHFGRLDRRRCSRLSPISNKKATQTNLSGCGKHSSSPDRKAQERHEQTLQTKL
jgi:hypothetical protein